MRHRIRAILADCVLINHPKWISKLNLSHLMVDWDALKVLGVYPVYFKPLVTEMHTNPCKRT